MLGMLCGSMFLGSDRGATREVVLRFTLYDIVK